ncbi:hypothetical protein PHSC3_000474 [Chlamydiales bacterium STE3]|nr:hypothetical protein PHSC3_000474 [Chlamydiales bacterium STE3]
MKSKINYILFFSLFAFCSSLSAHNHGESFHFGGPHTGPRNIAPEIHSEFHFGPGPG